MVTLSEKKLQGLMNRCYLEGFRTSSYTWNGAYFQDQKKNPERNEAFRTERDEALRHVKLA